MGESRPLQAAEFAASQFKLYMHGEYYLIVPTSTFLEIFLIF